MLKHVALLQCRKACTVRVKFELSGGPELDCSFLFLQQVLSIKSECRSLDGFGQRLREKIPRHLKQIYFYQMLLVFFFNVT